MTLICCDSKEEDNTPSGGVTSSYTAHLTMSGVAENLILKQGSHAGMSTPILNNAITPVDISIIKRS
jgi:hypothetical protein